MSTLPSSTLDPEEVALEGVGVVAPPWALRGAGGASVTGVAATGVGLLGSPEDTSTNLLLARVGWGEPGGGGCFCCLGEGEKEGGGATGSCCCPA